jgi:hypothetical protein
MAEEKRRAQRIEADTRAMVSALPDVSAGLLPFATDSPFWRRDLAVQEERLEKMGQYLKEVC